MPEIRRGIQLQVCVSRFTTYSNVLEKCVTSSVTQFELLHRHQCRRHTTFIVYEYSVDDIQDIRLALV